MWIPPGFAHGFLVTSKHAEFLYKTTNYWVPEYERCIGWNDPGLDIPSMQAAPLLSAKDQNGPLMCDADLFSVSAAPHHGAPVAVPGSTPALRLH